MNKKPMMSLHGISKKYDDQTVVNHVNLDVYDRDVLCLIGRSGSGKSTLLRMMNLLETPTSGTIYFDDVPITNGKIKQSALRQHVGMVFQAFNLFVNKTVLENCMLGPLVTKTKTKKDAEILARHYLNSVGMLGYANAKVTTLSGGQKQRVAIARALTMQPRILLFDEPTSALDPELVDEVLQVMRQLAHDGLTMIIVTHEMDFARDVASRIVYLDEGQIVESGQPQEIFLNPKEERTRQFLKRYRG